MNNIFHVRSCWLAFRVQGTTTIRTGLIIWLNAWGRWGNRRIKEYQKYGNRLYCHRTMLDLLTAIGATLWPFSRVFRQVVLHPRTQMIKTTLKSIDIKLENQMSASIKLNYPFLCFSCCSWIRFVTLKMRFVLFTDIKCYVPITHFVPQGLERIYAPSLHLAFMSEHNAASGDLWHADKSKGSVHPNLFSHFICTIFCWRNCPPWTIISALCWISRAQGALSLETVVCVSYQKGTQSSIYLYCTGVFLILKRAVLDCIFLFFFFFLQYFGELTFYVNLSMKLSWIKESKCSTISCIY